METKETFDTHESQVDSKRTYEVPCIEDMTEMTFAKEAWMEFCNGNWCFDCSNCSCR
jgi:hypothetical protein